MSHLYYLLQFDHPTKTGVHWSSPVYAIEDITKNVLRALFIGVVHRDRTHYEAEVVDYVMEKLGSVPDWQDAKSFFEKTPGTSIKEDVSAGWVERRPNARFGTSLETALVGETFKPLVEVGLVHYRVAPRPNISNVLSRIHDSRGLGAVFEDFLRAKLSKIASVVTGPYFRLENIDVEMGEVDALCHSESNDKMIIFECKAVSGVPARWPGGYHALLDFFQKAFLQSQEQLLRVERTLREEGVIYIRKPNGGWYNISLPGSILRVSVSLLSFGDLHMPPCGGKLLDHFRHLRLQASPPIRLFDQIGDYQSKIREHISAMETFGVDSSDIFSKTLFLDANLITGFSSQSKTVDELFDTLWTFSGRGARGVVGRIGHVED